jgi:hypothetical protein
MADPPQFTRLSPSRLRLLGKSPKARHYVEAPALAAIEALERLAATDLGALAAAIFTTPITTITHRAYETARNAFEFGQPVTREKRTEKLRRGEAQYRSERAREQSDYMRRTRPFNVIGKLTWRDRRQLDNWKNRGMKVDLRPIFDRYPREQVLDALGSPQRNSHTRKLAA